MSKNGNLIESVCFNFPQLLCHLRFPWMLPKTAFLSSQPLLAIVNYHKSICSLLMLGSKMLAKKVCNFLTLQFFTNIAHAMVINQSLKFCYNSSINWFPCVRNITSGFHILQSIYSRCILCYCFYMQPALVRTSFVIII